LAQRAFEKPVKQIRLAEPERVGSQAVLKTMSPTRGNR
jgi:hypothetical protein